MFVVVYVPEGGDAEVFGPFSSTQPAIAAMRRIAQAAGASIEQSHSDLLATINVNMAGESHRYQLLKIGSAIQLEAHAFVIASEREENAISVESRGEPLPPTRLSGY